MVHWQGVFYCNGEALGGYPLSWFDLDGEAGPITRGQSASNLAARSATPRRCGHPWAPAGRLTRATVRLLTVARHKLPATTVSQTGAQLSDAGSIVGNCYLVDIHYTTNSDWGTYLFYGGTGVLVAQ